MIEDTVSYAQPYSYRYYTTIAMLYLACELASMVLAYKIIRLPLFYGSAASIIFPITYTWNDILTEVYGYHAAKRVVWSVFVADALFVALTFLVALLPSVTTAQQGIYHQVLSPLWRALLAEIVGVVVGIFINSAVLSKWKVLVKGRWFWLRSIGSSAMGELMMLVISVPIAMLGVLSVKQITLLMVFAYSYKLVFATVISWPAGIAVNFLKASEGVDQYDVDISYNPFH